MDVVISNWGKFGQIVLIMEEILNTFPARALPGVSLQRSFYCSEVN